MKETKVVKFGGSSLADAKQFKKVAEIILDDPTRRFVDGGICAEHGGG